MFRSTDGGETWEKVLYKDENTGAIAIAFDPKNPQILYADLWAARQAPWEVGASFNGSGSGLFKSTDGGTTWRTLTEGLPDVRGGTRPDRDRRRAFRPEPALRPGGRGRRACRHVSFRRRRRDLAPRERGDARLGPRRRLRRGEGRPDQPRRRLCREHVDVPLDRRGQHVHGDQGRAGRRRLPHDLDQSAITRRFCCSPRDQGATISVNGGRTWSSWYNQPTAQFYHVITDNRFPYWVYGGQQESGSAAVVSRGDSGAITSRDWHPVGVEEYGYVAPDPLDPNIIYGGKITRFDQRTGEIQDISPQPLRGGPHRFVRTMPVVFAPTDPHTLYLGSNVVFRTRNGGRSWDAISPDLTRESYETPPPLGIFAPLDPEKGKHRGVVYSIAPSSKDGNVIWAGTDDGLVHVTRDGGKTWKNVTPPGLTPWSKVSLLEASGFDAGTAYAAVNRFRLDDLRPHIYRTRDYGGTWVETVHGISESAVVNAVREDPKHKGLLFAGTERGVFVSFDDGGEWQPLQLNLPTSSVRDLVVHGDDLVVGTHGRSFWILDDISPLRQMGAEVSGADAFLFAPATATRVRRSTWTDTPLPPEEPAGQNPPDGAILDYVLKAPARGPVRIEIADAKGRLIRAFSSDDKPEPADPALNVPTYWVRPAAALAATAGMHRFVWDLRLPPPDVAEHEYPISAVPGDTPRGPLGAPVLPATYTVRLIASGKTLTRPLTVRMDPRFQVSPAALQRQFELASGISDALHRDSEALAALARLRARVASALPRASGAARDVLAGLDAKLAALQGSGAGRRGGRGPGETLSRVNGGLAELYAIVEGSDEAPTTQAEAAWKDLQDALFRALAAWEEIRSADLPAANRELAKAGAAEIRMD